MKEKLIIAAITLSTALPVLAGSTLPDGAGRLPEPSTLGLFAAAAIAIAVLSKLKK